MKRYHVTTFGCQMNEHDSERMKGMLESLGYAESATRADADLILFNTCSIREKADDRFVAHLGEAKRLKRERPDVVVGVGGCWAQSVKEEVFARFPFVDVAFGPGQVHKLAEFLTSDSLTAQGFFEFEGFTGHLPDKRAREFQAWVQISVGCNCRCSYCIVPSTRGREVSRPLDELVAEVERLAADGVREVTLLGQNVNSYGRDLRPEPRGRSASCCAPSTRSTASTASATRARTRRTCARTSSAPTPSSARCASTSTCRCSRGRRRILKAMRRTYDREPLPRPGRADPRARARLRADDRHHRRLPGGDRGGLRPDARGRARRSATTAPSRSSTRRAAGPRRPRSPRASCRTRSRSSACSASSRSSSGARASARSGSSAGRSTCSSKGRRGPIRRALRGRSRHNKAVNFAGLARPGEIVPVEIHAATSQTLAGEESLLSRATA